MNLEIVCSPTAKEHIKLLSFGLGERDEIVAELIYGKFEGEEYDYFNLSFPQDYSLNSDLPYFKIENIKVVVANKEIAKTIMSKKLTMKDNELNFE